MKSMVWKLHSSSIKLITHTIVQVYANLDKLRYRVPIVYLSEQSTGVTAIGHSIVRLNNKNVRGRHCLTAVI